MADNNTLNDTNTSANSYGLFDPNDLVSRMMTNVVNYQTNQDAIHKQYEEARAQATAEQEANEATLLQADATNINTHQNDMMVTGYSKPAITQITPEKVNVEFSSDQIEIKVNTKQNRRDMDLEWVSYAYDPTGETGLTLGASWHAEKMKPVYRHFALNMIDHSLFGLSTYCVSLDSCNHDFDKFFNTNISAYLCNNLFLKGVDSDNSTKSVSYNAFERYLYDMLTRGACYCTGAMTVQYATKIVGPVEGDASGSISGATIVSDVMKFDFGNRPLINKVNTALVELGEDIADTAKTIANAVEQAMEPVKEAIKEAVDYVEKGIAVVANYAFVGLCTALNVITTVDQTITSILDGSLFSAALAAAEAGNLKETNPALYYLLKMGDYSCKGIAWLVDNSKMLESLAKKIIQNPTNISSYLGIVDVLGIDVSNYFKLPAVFKSKEFVSGCNSFQHLNKMATEVTKSIERVSRATGNPISFSSFNKLTKNGNALASAVLGKTPVNKTASVIAGITGHKSTYNIYSKLIRKI